MDETVPDHIANYAKQIEKFGNVRHLSYADRSRVATAKLKIAVWACEKADVPLTQFALSEILGPETSFVFANALETLVELNWATAEDRYLFARRREALVGGMAGESDKRQVGRRIW